MQSDRVQRTFTFWLRTLALAWVGLSDGGTRAELSSANSVEFFEKRIRPVLVERCHKCHSATSEKLKGELHLDSRAGVLKGGESGQPALVPGNPEASRLIEAIRYGNVDLQMPPKNKLSAAQIEDFVAWVKMGAPWPGGDTAGPAPVAAKKKSEFNLEQRKQAHWSWKPISPVTPPEVRQADWPRRPADRFILAKLEAAGLKPAPEAEPHTLARRLYFDLIGLPPTPAELEEFLQDRSPEALEKLADRLLASPHFGERWARHWLDLMRYAETLGHEFDYAMPNAWRYRDYVIRAFNADVPYDQFATEHLAGDLLPNPRRHPTEHFNESIIGTGCFWLGQQTHSPVDVRANQSEVIDNQIDVLSKTFLGLTVACARCHDHKFDPIPTRDFYSIYGMIGSSRYAQRAIDAPERIVPKVRTLKALKARIRKALADAWPKEAERVKDYLLAANEVLRASSPAAVSTNAAAAKFDVDAAQLARWIGALRDKRLNDRAHPMYAWGKLAGTNAAADFGAAWIDWVKLQADVASATRSSSPGQPRTSTRPHLATPAASDKEFTFADFSRGTMGGWSIDGEALATALHEVGEILVGDTAKPVARVLPEAGLNSAVFSRRLQGAIRSPTFTVTNRFAHIRAAGRDSRINVVIDNFIMIQDPIYGGLRRVLDRDDLGWITVDLSMWQGHRAYFEFGDLSCADPAAGGRPGGYGPVGWVALERVVVSDDKAPPTLPAPDFIALLGEGEISSIESLAAQYAAVVKSAVERWKHSGPGRPHPRESADSQAASPNSDSTRADVAVRASAPGSSGILPASREPNEVHDRTLLELAELSLLDWLAQHGLLTTGGDVRLESLLAEYREIEATVPEPTLVPALADGTGLDDVVFIRGNARTPGEIAPRRFLEAIAGQHQPPFRSGSGRLEFARRMTDSSNPFFARVMVNRVWHHLFGRGIVPTPDDFGVLGQPPSHPELLDGLAEWFRTEAGWSTKRLVRLLVTSSTYRMSSRPTDALAEGKDPMNLLWHRMEVRRLEGEAIRDAILALSGRLDKTMFGPAVPVHLTPFMEGRGRPGKSGPLDGEGRRSVYLEVRRNFLSPMMRAFDAPVPMSTIGRRTLSNVPAQSLILMNDPFVVAETERWAKNLIENGPPSATERIQQLYLATFSRPASPGEVTEALTFLEQQEKTDQRTDAGVRTQKAWADLCHVLLNVKEFVFVN